MVIEGFRVEDGRCVEVQGWVEGDASGGAGVGVIEERWMAGVREALKAAMRPSWTLVSSDVDTASFKIVSDCCLRRFRY